MTMVSSSKKPFDTAWKQGLSEPEVAKNFFQRRLPNFIKQMIDFSHFFVQKTHYVSDEGKHSYSDIVYKTKLSGKNESTYLYLLAENQRTPDKHLVLRMMRYLVNIIDDHITENKSEYFPIVFPLVYYNGKRTPYPYSMNFWERFESPKLAKMIMDRPIHLIDANQLPDNYGKKDVAAMLELVLKYMGTNKDFLGAVQQLQVCGNLKFTYEQGGEKYLNNMLRLGVEKANISDKKAFFDILDESHPHLGDNVMNLLQKEHADGHAKGHAKGHAEGRAEGLKEAAKLLTIERAEGRAEGLKEAAKQREEGLKETAVRLLKLSQTVDFVAQATQLSRDTIQTIKADLQAKNLH